MTGFVVQGHTWKVVYVGAGFDRSALRDSGELVLFCRLNAVWVGLLWSKRVWKQMVVRKRPSNGSGIPLVCQEKRRAGGLHPPPHHHGRRREGGCVCLTSLIAMETDAVLPWGLATPVNHEAVTTGTPRCVHGSPEEWGRKTRDAFTAALLQKYSQGWAISTTASYLTKLSSTQCTPIMLGFYHHVMNEWMIKNDFLNSNFFLSEFISNN